jgi:hypothetical protein
MGYRYPQSGGDRRDTMVEPASALAAAKQIDEAVGLIAKLLGKLRAQPDIAALKLSAALDEIVKTYEVLDRAFTTYGNLAIDEGALASKSQELLSIAGGTLGVRVQEGRGSCHEIRNIYNSHLRRWFEHAFNPDEQKQIEDVFIGPNGLGWADDTLFQALTSLALQLKDDAQGVVALVMSDTENREAKARESVRQTYFTLAPVQQAMAQSMQRMFELKNAFIQVAKTTSAPR